MNWSTVRTLVANELRMLLRDRRTIIFSVVLPIVFMPAMILGQRAVFQRREKGLTETIYLYAVTGTRAEEVRALIRQAVAAVQNDPKPAIDSGEKDLRRFKHSELRVRDPEAALKSKEIHFYLETLTGTEADSEAEKEKKSSAKKKPEAVTNPFATVTTRLPGTPVVRIRYEGNRDAASAGQSRMRELLARARTLARDELLREHNFPADPAKVLGTENVSLASAAQVTGSTVGRFLTVLLVMFLLSGGAVAAMDIVAGEKERGSLETLLTTAVTREDIIAAKQLTILSVGLFIALVQVANVLVYVSFRIVELPKDFVIEAPPATIVTLLLLFVPLAALLSSVLLMLSTYAKTYKEAQTYFLPLYLVSLIPSLAAVLPGVKLRSAIVLVPLANVSVAVREAMVGKHDWPMIGATFVVMVAAALGTMRASAKLLSQERLITASESDAADLSGGPALFPKHVLRWYAVLAALLFAVAANVPQLASFRRQLVFNEIVIFLGAPALMIWKYRLNIRDALALRPVKPAVWLAVLLIIPSGNIIAVGVFRLANLVFPVPRQVLEQFGSDLMPSIPVWQLYFFISILPGICEEIGFRGTLLYGLRRRFRPAILALVVGIIFGFFHVSLFRILPTGFMGVILTAVALLTGSIFPGMVAHAGNNAFAFWMARNGFSLVNLNSWLYFDALAVFALAVYIIYRNRTPYPGLRTKSVVRPRSEGQRAA